VEKLSLKEKASYGLGDFASQLSWQVVSSYLLVFYTDVFGLAPAMISIILLVARVWDGINDPMMGMIMERTKSRWGRFRPYLLFMGPIMALFNVLTFLAPNIGGTAKIVYAFVTYIGLGMSYTAINIPYGGLATVMSTDTSERASLNMWRTIGAFSGAFFVNLATMRLIQFFGKGGGNGYLMTVIIYSIASVPMFFICFKNCKERCAPKPGQHITIQESIHCVVANKPLLAVMLYSFLQNLSMNLRLGTLAYYFIYVVGNPTLMATLLPMEIVCAIISTPIGTKFANKVGMKKASIIGSIIRSVAIALLFFVDPSNIALLTALTVIVGLSNFFGATTNTMVATCIDYAEDKLGVRADGTIYAASSLVTKIASAVAGSVGVLAIAAFGYVANASQSPSALMGIRYTSQLIPAILCLASGISLALYHLSESDHKEILKRLDARKND